MKIAFLGKGGSGKSTLATAMARHLHGAGNRVLAIDADHNMDLAFNLGAESLPSHIGSDPALIKRHIGLDNAASFLEVRAEAERRGITFRLSPPDEYTARLAAEVRPGLFVMAAGPHTDVVRSGEHCSHSLAAPLKAYLPLLALADGEAAVIDERAGTDPVATGILNGADVAVIVAEPSVHSVRVARQIANELAIAGVPHVFVANKVSSEHPELRTLPASPVARIPFGRSVAPEMAAAILEACKQRAAGDAYPAARRSHDAAACS